MKVVIGLALVVLGLAVGFIVTWALRVEQRGVNLFVGLLLVAAGAIVGFVSEWLIDEAYRKNRELRRQLGRGEGTALAAVSGAGGDDSTPETLAEFLQRRDEEGRELREQVATARAQLDALGDEFEAYQRMHPDNLTVIKGIGSVYQWRLRDVGINTYEQLAEADPARLRRMLSVRGWQRANVESWVEQARDWAQRDQ